MMQPLTKYIATILERYHDLGDTGILDPESKKTGFANPRFQEACLTLALAVRHEIGLPEGVPINVVETAAVRSMEQWFRMLDRGKAVRCSPDGVLDVHATAYGLFATAKTITLLGDRTPSYVRALAHKSMRGVARHLIRSRLPAGLETRPIRAAALTMTANWIGDARIGKAAQSTHQAGLKLLRDTLEGRTNDPLDQSALSLTLAYLALRSDSPCDEEIELWGMISGYCLRSTTPTGIPGGGAESSLASLPLSTGFALAAEHSPEAATMAKLLENGWRSGWFDPMLDPNIPWLTPMSYLALMDRALRPESRKLSRLATASAKLGLDSSGAGRIELGDWTLRLGPGATIGWLHHNPSNSSRAFGSPAGLALREGPWLIENNRMRQPAIAGRFKLNSESPVQIEGSLLSVPIPTISRSPRSIGQPDWQDRDARVGTRIVPPVRQKGTRSSGAIPYRRLIEMKDGALSIETQVKGKILHRIPLIWPGGMFGEVIVDHTPLLPGQAIHQPRARELIFRGGPWPDWVLRFDRPVDLKFDPIHVSITAGPMRYLAAATATLDIVAEDRLRVFWRVAD